MHLSLRSPCEEMRNSAIGSFFIHMLLLLLYEIRNGFLPHFLLVAAAAKMRLGFTKPEKSFMKPKL